MYGYPQYMRLEGTGTLNVQWNGNNQTARAPAVWEVSLCTLSSIFLLHTLFLFLYFLAGRLVLQ